MPANQYKQRSLKTDDRQIKKEQIIFTKQRQTNRIQSKISSIEIITQAIHQQESQS